MQTTAPGIAFLSGGQSEGEATGGVHIYQVEDGLPPAAPWQPTLSHGRACRRCGVS
jgi:fructose-bisphosphate aldolase class 1